jgi:hypothetical protein
VCSVSLIVYVVLCAIRIWLLHNIIVTCLVTRDIRILLPPDKIYLQLIIIVIIIILLEQREILLHLRLWFEEIVSIQRFVRLLYKCMKLLWTFLWQKHSLVLAGGVFLWKVLDRVRLFADIVCPRYKGRQTNPYGSGKWRGLEACSATDHRLPIPTSHLLFTRKTLHYRSACPIHTNFPLLVWIHLNSRECRPHTLYNLF